MISKIWEKIKYFIFIDEFDEIYENATTKTIFVLYCCLGGFCFHENVRMKFRKAWIIFNTLSFLFVNVSCLFYLFNKPTNDYYAWLLPAPAMSGVLCRVAIYAWMYQGKDLLSKLIAFFNSTPEEEVTFALFCTARLKKRQVEIIAGVSCILFFFTMNNNLGHYVSYGNYLIYHYPTYFPFDKTITLSLAIRFVQCVTIIPEILFVAFPSLIIIITILIYNRFKLLGLFLRQTSYSVFLQMDEACNLEAAMDEKRTLRSLSRIHEVKIKRAFALDELIRKIVIVIERHQELHSLAKLYAEQMDYLCTIIHTQLLMVSVTLAFFISSVRLVLQKKKKNEK
ncbi:uncharacterized protein LOC135847754 [Planococcus citri]|uniref:uncharacterized protein LOC135847754 n=1 Tax=Planococcus citri TaxID=170843 RepID=UPI0031F7CC67